MKQCLVDVNVVVALLVPRHVHHQVAHNWFGDLISGQVGLCRLAQLAVVRLLGNPKIMGTEALSVSDGWSVVQKFLEDDRIEFLKEPPSVESFITATLDHPHNPAKLVTDGYLAAFAMSSHRKFVTFDRDFLRFRGLELELLVRQ